MKIDSIVKSSFSGDSPGKMKIRNKIEISLSKEVFSGHCPGNKNKKQGKNKNKNKCILAGQICQILETSTSNSGRFHRIPRKLNLVFVKTKFSFRGGGMGGGLFPGANLGHTGTLTDFD